MQRHIPLKLGLNEFSGYSAPNNVDFVGGTFMYAGFVPASLASIDNEQGFQVCNASWFANKDHIALPVTMP